MEDLEDLEALAVKGVQVVLEEEALSLYIYGEAMVPLWICKPIRGPEVQEVMVRMVHRV
jgi:hypothetical protein